MTVPNVADIGNRKALEKFSELLRRKGAGRLALRRGMPIEQALCPRKGRGGGETKCRERGICPYRRLPCGSRVFSASRVLAYSSREHGRKTAVRKPPVSGVFPGLKLLVYPARRRAELLRTSSPFAPARGGEAGKRSAWSVGFALTAAYRAAPAFFLRPGYLRIPTANTAEKRPSGSLL